VSPRYGDIEMDKRCANRLREHRLVPRQSSVDKVPVGWIYMVCLDDNCDWFGWIHEVCYNDLLS
jgi:hypothetical protein